MALLRCAPPPKGALTPLQAVCSAAAAAGPKESKMVESLYFSLAHSKRKKGAVSLPPRLLTRSLWARVHSKLLTEIAESATGTAPPSHLAA